MKKSYVIVRNLTSDECEWLEHIDIKQGTIVYQAIDFYNCCSNKGVPVSKNPSGIPYFEVPRDAVTPYTTTNEAMSNSKLILTVAHNIYLTREQRYELKAPNAVLITEGVSVPVWVKDGRSNEPAEEVFCRYRICHIPNEIDKHIRFLNDGYEISITTQMQKRLLDIIDEGSGCLIFANHGKVKVNEKLMAPVIHYVSIHDYSTLIDTM